MNGEQRYRVYNKTKFDIGVPLLNGQNIVIRNNSFQLLSVNDMMYIESMCRQNKFFSQKMLVPVNEKGEEMTLESLGMYADDSKPAYISDDEIKTNLKMTATKMKAWLDTITDDAQLYAVYLVAKEMDLPSSKLKILKDRIPNQDFLE